MQRLTLGMIVLTAITVIELCADDVRVDVPRPLVIGHRGASGYRPEHTLESYRLAIDQGADFIEPDVVSTKDGVLVARHENEIGTTTDAADRFPAMKTTKVIDGQEVSGWFVEDFTLAEVKRLRARERLPFRSHELDGRFGIPTLDEIVALAAHRSQELGRAIGVYPETKHPSYFRGIGLPLEEPLVKTLEKYGLTRRNDGVFIQSFEPSSLVRLRQLTKVRLVQLLDAEGSPWDFTRAGDRRSFSDLTTSEGLHEIARYADGIGVHKRLIVPAAIDGTLLPPTDLVDRAHAAGLFVHVWTMRSEPSFLSSSYHDDPTAEYRQFAGLGIDGIFSDVPDVAVRALR